VDNDIQDETERGITEKLKGKSSRAKSVAGPVGEKRRCPPITGRGQPPEPSEGWTPEENLRRGERRCVHYRRYRPRKETGLSYGAAGTRPKTRKTVMRAREKVTAQAKQLEVGSGNSVFPKKRDKPSPYPAFERCTGGRLI